MALSVIGVRKVLVEGYQTGGKIFVVHDPTPKLLRVVNKVGLGDSGAAVEVAGLERNTNNRVCHFDQGLIEQCFLSAKCFAEAAVLLMMPLEPVILPDRVYRLAPFGHPVNRYVEDGLDEDLEINEDSTVEVLAYAVTAKFIPFVSVWVLVICAV